MYCSICYRISAGNAPCALSVISVGARNVQHSTPLLVQALNAVKLFTKAPFQFSYQGEGLPLRGRSDNGLSPSEPESPAKLAGPACATSSSLCLSYTRCLHLRRHLGPPQYTRSTILDRDPNHGRTNTLPVQSRHAQEYDGVEVENTA